MLSFSATRREQSCASCFRFVSLGLYKFVSFYSNELRHVAGWRRVHWQHFRDNFEQNLLALGWPLGKKIHQSIHGLNTFRFVMSVLSLLCKEAWRNARRITARKSCFADHFNLNLISCFCLVLVLRPVSYRCGELLSEPWRAAEASFLLLRSGSRWLGLLWHTLLWWVAMDTVTPSVLRRVICLFLEISTTRNRSWLWYGFRRYFDWVGKSLFAGVQGRTVQKHELNNFGFPMSRAFFTLSWYEYKCLLQLVGRSSFRAKTTCVSQRP